MDSGEWIWTANGTASQSPSGLPQSLIPQNLMKMVAQQQQQQELPDLSSMSLGALGGLGGGTDSGTGAGTGTGTGTGTATAEVTIEQIEEIRRLVAYNPILTGPLLEQIKQEDPDLYNYIGGDPEKLLTALVKAVPKVAHRIYSSLVSLATGSPASSCSRTRFCSRACSRATGSTAAHDRIANYKRHTGRE
ncbi:hypothetical protein EI94DRAFT_470621 [Lactarius quietus]|nr:hypothetical protein EI94DRAFT_470621 [Lactarius quietus]